MHDYLTNQLDRACLLVTPTLMAPRFGVLPEIKEGEQRFIIASDGVYIEARTPTIHARLRVSETKHPFPYGEVAETIKFYGGRIPYAVIQKARQRAVESSPKEWGGSICWSPERGYWLDEPEILVQTGASLSYRNTVDETELVVDIHSHGLYKSFFSRTDDVDDIERGGVYVAAVIGECSSASASAVATMKIAMRMVINGHLIKLGGVAPWETVSATIDEICGEDAAEARM